MGEERPRVIVIGGPTAVGKTSVSLALAEAIGGEIVNYDSVQLYRGFDIGSAKPTAAERARAPHHLIDVAEPDEHFTAARFESVASAVCQDIFRRGRTPILVGGTGFYLRAFLSGLPPLPEKNEPLRERLRAIAARPRGAVWLHRWLARRDPRAAARIPAADRHRVERALEVVLLTGRPISDQAPPSPRRERVASAKFALALPRPELIARQERRVEAMYAAGLVEETAGLLQRYPLTSRPFQAIGYREAVAVIRLERTLAEALGETKRRTRAYGKRQMTWLRGEEGMKWIDADRQPGPIVDEILALLSPK